MDMVASWGPHPLIPSLKRECLHVTVTNIKPAFSHIDLAGVTEIHQEFAQSASMPVCSCLQAVLHASKDPVPTTYISTAYAASFIAVGGCIKTATGPAESVIDTLYIVTGVIIAQAHKDLLAHTYKHSTGLPPRQLGEEDISFWTIRDL